MARLKYLLSVSKFIDDEGRTTLEKCKEFSVKKDAIEYAKMHNYLDGTKYYTLLYTTNGCKLLS